MVSPKEASVDRGMVQSIVSGHSHCTVVSFMTAEIHISDVHTLPVKVDEEFEDASNPVTTVVVEVGAEVVPLAPLPLFP